MNRSKSTTVVMEGECGPLVKLVSWLFPLMKNTKLSNTLLLHRLKIDVRWLAGKCLAFECPWGVWKDIKISMSQNTIKEMIIFPVCTKVG